MRRHSRSRRRARGKALAGAANARAGRAGSTFAPGFGNVVQPDRGSSPATAAARAGNLAQEQHQLHAVNCCARGHFRGDVEFDQTATRRACAVGAREHAGATAIAIIDIVLKDRVVFDIRGDVESDAPPIVTETALAEFGKHRIIKTAVSFQSCIRPGSLKRSISCGVCSSGDIQNRVASTSADVGRRLCSRRYCRLIDLAVQIRRANRTREGRSETT